MLLDERGERLQKERKEELVESLLHLQDVSRSFCPADALIISAFLQPIGEVYPAALNCDDF